MTAAETLRFEVELLKGQGCLRFEVGKVEILGLHLGRRDIEGEERHRQKTLDQAVAL
jgi:hypothetical protein